MKLQNDATLSTFACSFKSRRYSPDSEAGAAGEVGGESAARALRGAAAAAAAAEKAGAAAAAAAAAEEGGECKCAEGEGGDDKPCVARTKRAVPTVRPSKRCSK